MARKRSSYRRRRRSRSRGFGMNFGVKQGSKVFFIGGNYRKRSRSRYSRKK